MRVLVAGATSVPGLPLLRLAQGRRGAAQAAIRRAVGELQPPHRRAAVLAACVEIMIEGSDLQAARAAADELSTMMTRCEAPYLRALAAHATGSLLLAEGDATAALKLLRQAWMGWQEIDAPWEAGRVRLLLGMTCRALGDEESAHLEFDAAQRVFDRLGAAPDLARVKALRTPCVASRDPLLTSRERQVLALVARGMTNRAIADALAISDRAGSMPPRSSTITSAAGSAGTVASGNGGPVRGLCGSRTSALTHTMASPAARSRSHTAGCCSSDATACPT